ncbi:MAG TPA: hypothetical protein VIT91_16095 [Chthoniobacterales bacterium]
MGSNPTPSATYENLQQLRVFRRLGRHVGFTRSPAQKYGARPRQAPLTHRHDTIQPAVTRIASLETG